MSKSFDILLVEDNPDLASNIIDYLEALGHRMHYAADGESGLREALVRPIDILLLDLALPNRDGLSVCSELRRCADRRIPILMLTARDTLDDKLAGFAHGADDYLVKPFSLAELAARVAALTLRPQLGQSHRFVVGPLTIDRQARIATRDGSRCASLRCCGNCFCCWQKRGPILSAVMRRLRASGGMNRPRPTRCARICTCCARWSTSLSTSPSSRPYIVSGFA